MHFSTAAQCAKTLELYFAKQPDLQVVAANAALQAAGLDPKAVDSVCVGNVLSASGVDTPYIARHVALRVGERKKDFSYLVHR